MKRSFVAVLATAIACTAAKVAHTQTALVSPTDWQCGSTGGGTPKWTWEAEPSGARVLKQSGNAPFPWCVKPDTKLVDGFVEVKFKPPSGREDQAGGLVWRWQDGDNYYVARANALENNVSLYYTTGGRRHTLQYVDAPVAANTGIDYGLNSVAYTSPFFWMANATSKPTTAISPLPAGSACGPRPTA